MKTKITNKITTPVLVFLALILFSATNGTAAPGDLDSTFGNGGIVVTPFTNFPYFEQSQSMRVQPDGKIVVGGGIYDGDGNEIAFFLARYHPTGALDASFGTNGKIIGPYLGGVLVNADIGLQADGKIVAVGNGAFAGNGFAVHRYHTNGTLDASFGTGGVVITTVGSGYSFAQSVAVQANGKIVVVGGNRSSDFVGDFAIVRYNPDGSLDTSFNGTGKVITSFSSGSAAKAIALQPDGKIVAAGYMGFTTGSISFALARYNEDGSLDSGFGAGGKVFHSIPNGRILLDVALQPDGKIVAAGEIVFGTSGTVIVRYNQNGLIDTSFAANGIFTTEANFRVGNGIALQSNGKLVAFGNLINFSNTTAGFAVARLNPNGTPDLGFGTNGRVITPINNYAAATAGVVQSDGKILALGFTSGNGNEIAIVRYLGDSVALSSVRFDFDGDLRADVSVFRPSDRIWYLNQSTNGFFATQFGLSSDKITPADFDGDGKTDISVYRDGTWYWLNSSTNSFNARQFGLPDDIPVPADYTGDGYAELTIYRNGAWWSLNLRLNYVYVVNFGLASDKPVPADYDGDGRTDQAVYRNGEWHINRSSNGYTVINWGLPTDKLVPADYDGDGKTDPAVYRDGTWYLLQSLHGWGEFQWGISTDIPAPADYDGDGRADAAIFRDGVWWLRQSTNGIAVQQFGLATDKPVPAAYLP